MTAPSRQNIVHWHITGPIEHDTERSLVTVVDDEDHRPPEVGVEHRGGGDQE
jgi:hypothetical protein